MKFLNQPEDKNDLENIRKATLKGKPIGKEKFLERIAKALGITIETRPKGRPRKVKKLDVSLFTLLWDRSWCA